MALQKLIFVLIASLILINLSADAQNTPAFYDCNCAQKLCSNPCKSGKSACDNCKSIDIPKQCSIQCKIN
uniref:Candidate secreted effector Minc08014 n=1 Tax=Meloidogyne incognita TaxID=6306 RepID=A0A343JGY0_MELIC|nr:candidate secreted effector Minc08014 [Meloidogyne incognita]